MHVVTIGSYHALTTRAQVARIRRVAEAAIGHYEVEPVRMRLLCHEFNTTFRFDTADGRRFALRVNVNSDKQPGNLDAELAWLAALADEADVRVPMPLPTRAGEFRTSAWCDELGRDLPVVVMSWLPGKDLAEGTPESVRALGRTMAVLHEHAAGWEPPPGCWFPSLERVLVDQPDRLADEHPVLGDAGRAVLVAAHDAAQRATDAVLRRGVRHPLHADLHGGNAKWSRGRVAVFDFDDAAVGTPVQDLAISSYYLRDDETLEASLFEGYAEVRPLPDVAPDEFEALLAARNLVLVNDVLAGRGAADRDFGPAYIRNTVTKLAAFLDTGRYRHRVPGLEPISL